MSDPFTTKVKDSPCKCAVCEKEESVGSTLYMQNIGSEQEKRWIFSPHASCFEAIQKDPDKYQPKKSSGSGGKGWGGKGTTINNIEDVSAQMTRHGYFLQVVPQIIEAHAKIVERYKGTEGISLGEFLKLHAYVLIGKIPREASP